MKSQSQYLVIYKDSPTSLNRYYGPFVSPTVADTFCANLPKPQPGGVKTWKFIQPHEYTETEMASQAILSERDIPAHPIDAALAEGRKHLDTLKRLSS